MADVIPLALAKQPKTYSVEVTKYPDNLLFTVDGIKVNPQSLFKIADELEKIAQIIRADVVTGAV